jgi:hypothetical protein
VQHALRHLAIFSDDGNEARLRAYLNELLPEARLAIAPLSDPLDDFNDTQVGSRPPQAAEPIATLSKAPN